MGPVQVELLAQLDLPLPQHRLGREDEDALGPAREPRLAQQQPRLDGLAEADLVGDEEPRRPRRVEPLERAELVRPRLDGGGGLADPRPAAGQRRRVPDERPHEPAALVGRELGRTRRLLSGARLGRLGLVGRRRLRLQARGEVGREKAQQVAPGGVGHVEHDGARRAVGPEAREVALFARDPLGLGAPASVDVDALPVAPPAGRGLVQAAGPRDAVAGPVFDDARLLVEDGRVAHGPPVPARHGDLHVEVAAGDHPREQLERAGGVGVGRGQGQLDEASLDEVAQRRALADGVDLGRAEGAADDEAHAALVVHEPVDAARGQREGAGVEVAGQPVVARGVLQRGHVEHPDEVAVLGRVLELPGVVDEHGVSPVGSRVARSGPPGVVDEHGVSPKELRGCARGSEVGDAARRGPRVAGNVSATPESRWRRPARPSCRRGCARDPESRRCATRYGPRVVDAPPGRRRRSAVRARRTSPVSPRRHRRSPCATGRADRARRPVRRRRAATGCRAPRSRCRPPAGRRRRAACR